MYDHSGGTVKRKRERTERKKKERWGETDAKLTSLNISYQKERKKQRSSFDDEVLKNV